MTLKPIPSIVAVLAVCFSYSSAPAQVIYLPVQYQYGEQHKYYYGGQDPMLFARAEHDAALLAFQQMKNPLPQIYSDLFPFHNAYLFGFDRSDARNQAYRSQPRYFTKRQLLQSGFEVEGAWIVPATPPIRPLLIQTPAPAPKPARKGVILIIPKKPLRTDAHPAMFVSATR